MPDRRGSVENVFVTFDANASPQFKFNRESVEMHEEGTIIFHQRPANQPWKFITGLVKDDRLEEFFSAVRGQGRSLHIYDEFYDVDRTKYEYMIMVEFEGRYYMSPDPVIVNDPGGGGATP